MSIRTAYHNNIRKIIIAVGSLFDNLSLVTYNSDGKEVKRVKVPLIYSPKEKFITKLYSDPESVQKIQVSLPRASYEMTGFNYASDRMLQNTRTLTKKVDKLHQRVPVPYDFNFTFTLWVRNLEDGYQILESILPYFTPDFNVVINDDPEFNNGRALPIVLNGVSQDVQYEGPHDGRTRLVSFTLNLTAKGYIYPPTMEYDRIREVIVNIKDLHRSGTIFLKLKDTNGIFTQGEKVYQGVMEEDPDAEGTVVSHDTQNNILELSGSEGIFRTNVRLIGSKSLSYSDVICGCNRKVDLMGKLPPNHKLWCTIDITPDPKDANPEDEWKYNTKITEYE